MDAPRHPVGGVGNGLVGQVDVSPGGLDQGVAEQLGGGHHVHAVHGGGRGPPVTQVVDGTRLGLRIGKVDVLAANP